MYRMVTGQVILQKDESDEIEKFLSDSEVAFAGRPSQLALEQLRRKAASLLSRLSTNRPH